MVKREENTSLAANSAKILNYIILSLFPELDLNLGPDSLGAVISLQTNKPTGPRRPTFTDEFAKLI